MWNQLNQYIGLGRIPASLRFLGLLILLLPNLGFGQDKPRRVEKIFYPTISEPVELVDLAINDNTFNANASVYAGRDWLKKLKVRVKNTHSKPIVYLSAVLLIPKLGTMQYPHALYFTFGEIPPPDGNKNDTPGRNGKSVVPILAPDGEATLSLTNQQIGFLQKLMEEKQIADIDQVEIIFNFAVFSDGTAWSKGHLMHRDKKNPDKWNTVGRWPGNSTVFKSHSSPSMAGRCSGVSRQRASPHKNLLSPIFDFEAGLTNWPAFFTGQDIPPVACVYFEGSLVQPCSLSSCGSFCITQDPIDTVTRNNPDLNLPAGSTINITVNCTLPGPTCTCSATMKMVPMWQPPIVPCREESCYPTCSPGFSADYFNCNCRCDRPVRPTGAGCPNGNFVVLENCCVCSPTAGVLYPKVNGLRKKGKNKSLVKM